MKRCILYLCTAVFLYSCAIGQGSEDHTMAALPKPKKGEKVATFGGGCFWALTEAMSELKGVHQVLAGYAGGTVKNPTYEDVCTRTTGHAESVQIYYDPEIISYATLAEAFFSAHDPTTLNRQGPDEGTDYRSIAFYRTAEEKAVLQKAIVQVNQSHHFKNPVVTELTPFSVFYPAEKYHQGYYKLHPGSPYIQSVSVPKVIKMRKAMAANLKPEFSNK